MGRKIPGRKHRGVRDPEQQRQVRLDKFKNKINNPPKNIDEQHVPKSLKNLMHLKEKAKKKKNRLVISDSLFKPPKKQSVYKQLPNETDKQYLERIDNIVKEVEQEAEFSKKHDIKIKRNKKTGEIDSVERGEKDALKEYRKKVIQESKTKGKKNKKDDDEVRLTKRQKRTLKLQTKKEKRQNEKLEDEDVVHEHIGFGDIVHAPPTLSAPRGVQKLNAAARPGAKDLLLKSVINNNNNKENGKSKLNGRKLKADDTKLNKTSKVIDKKGKRKDLPKALRRQLDKQQTEIIKAYRDLKKHKNKI